MVKPGSEYYNLEKVAEVLSVSTAEVNRLREQSKLRGFRDGSNWKFLKDDVHNYLAASIKARSADANGKKSGDSDFDLAGDEDSFSSFDSLIEDAALLGDSDLVSIAPAQPKSDLDLAALDHDSDLALAEESHVSAIAVAKDTPVPQESLKSAVVQEDDGQEDSSALLLAADDLDSSAVLLEPEPEFHEVDLDGESILEAEGSSPQLGLAGDSGFDILLAADDAVADKADEEENIMQLEEANTEAVSFAADDFELEPSQIMMDADDSESSSQVMAIDVGLAGESHDDDPFGGGDDFDFMVGFDSGAAPSPHPIEAPASDPFGMGAPDSPMSDVFTPPIVSAAPKKAAQQEAEYSTGMLITLACALAALLLPGIMLIDTMAHMWSWNEPFILNSILMDTISSVLGL